MKHFTLLFVSFLPLLPPASVCFVVCLLSLAWALVLYARACSLIRPGHLHMTPAAILCRLLWRVGKDQHTLELNIIVYLWICTDAISLQKYFICLQVAMLGSRFAVLMLFTRVFRQWILGVLGKCAFQRWLSKLL